MTKTPIPTKAVTGRRKLQFQTLDDLQREVEFLVQTPTKVIGNWTLGEILEHLAKGLETSVDGVKFKPPLWMKLAGPFMLNYMIKNPMPAGFNMPASAAQEFRPHPETTPEQALVRLQTVIKRCQESDARPRHPVFGKWTAAQANQFHLRHAELHLSFVIPETEVE